MRILTDEDLIEYDAYSSGCPHGVCRNLYPLTGGYKELRDAYFKLVSLFKEANEVLDDKRE